MEGGGGSDNGDEIIIITIMMMWGPALRPLTVPARAIQYPISNIMLTALRCSPPHLLPLPPAERYAALTSSVLALHADPQDGPLESNLERMRYAVMNLLLQVGGGGGRGGVGRGVLCGPWGCYRGSV